MNRMYRGKVFPSFSFLIYKREIAGRENKHVKANAVMIPSLARCPDG